MEIAAGPRAQEPDATEANMVGMEAQVSESVGTSKEADLPEVLDRGLDREVNLERRVLKETPFG